MLALRAYGLKRVLKRDIEFDIEGDRDRCLYGLADDDNDMSPADARRVKDIFEDPAFFVEGSSRNAIQGGLGNDWFLSALATVGAMPGLMDKICVAVSIDTRSKLPLRTNKSHRETKKLEFTDSSSTWTADGSTSL